MPEPVPAPTALQIVTVADITMLTTDEVETMIAADSDQDISNAKWAITLEQITLWNDGIRDETGDIKKVGSIEFFEGMHITSRLDFRNMIRNRYGYPSLLSERQSAFAVSSLLWF